MTDAPDTDVRPVNISAPPARFQGRAFASVLVTCAMLALILTGVVLFITPPGRIANWTNWTLLGLTKETWGAVHIVSAALFLIGGILHIWHNWRPLIGYFKGRVGGRLSRRFALRGEWTLALALSAGVFAGAAADIAPFSWLPDWSSSIKASWDDPRASATSAAPATPAHAELLTLRQLAEQTSLDLTQALARLEARGIAIESPDAVVGEVAKANGLSPQALHEIAAGAEGHGAGSGQGRGKGGGGKGLGSGRGQGAGRQAAE